MPCASLGCLTGPNPHFKKNKKDQHHTLKREECSIKSTKIFSFFSENGNCLSSWLSFIKISSMASTIEENIGGAPASARLKLYSYWRSSCAWRVRIALNLKGIPYEYKTVNLLKGEQFSEDYTKLNPLQLVPTLVDGNVIVSDSTAILLYLEDKYPEHPLLPKDPRLKAISLQVSAIVGSSIQPLQNLFVLKRVEEKLGPEERLAWPKYFIEKGFNALEKLLKDVSGKYCIGDEVSLADVFLAPQVYSAARFNVDMTNYPTLNNINKALSELPEFQTACPERQPDAVA